MPTNVHALRAETRVFDLDDPSSLVLDLDNPKNKEVLALDEAFKDAIQNNSALAPLALPTGAHDITPELGVQLLLRNRPGVNRWLEPGTVFYYARQMAADDWRLTGQPILVDDHDILTDAQHRCYAGLISGKTFRSYVITGVPHDPEIFMYIDNCRARNAAAALQTAGFNGFSGIIARVLKFAEEVRAGKYNVASGITTLPRLSPADHVRIAGSYQNVQLASGLSTSDWKPATVYLERKDIVAYVGMRIIDLHDEGVAEDFFEDIASDEHPTDHPVSAFRKEFAKFERMKKMMPRHIMAANLILAFNAWTQNLRLGRQWAWTYTADFPEIVGPAPQQIAAE